MLTEERHQTILNALKECGTIKIQDLVELTNASESTIRRDLSQLEQERFLKRVHGGASKLQVKLKEMTVSERSTKNVHEKRMIAQYAANLVEENDCLFIDAGSTTIEMIPFLTQPGIVVVTNGLEQMKGLRENGIKTYIVGGEVKPTTGAIVGSIAMDSLRNYRFDKAFLGTNGIHQEFGFTTPDPEEARIKRQSISLSREAYILADESKFGEIAFAKISELEEATIVTNEGIDEQYAMIFKETTVKVVQK
ncbi:DeoR/GlpR family DNA-binding transcription regulator [Bacillus sp. 2205SS5-2]|uniref:DeoR/GlpR family DNA-binding transcription regulator n=1 Tax=Bacillus sp. 2205SS5-2 TaxID=3109031 RepID=UPI00300672B9